MIFIQNLKKRTFKGSFMASLSDLSEILNYLRWKATFSGSDLPASSISEYIAVYLQSSTMHL